MATFYNQPILEIRPDFRDMVHGQTDDFVFQTFGSGAATPWKPTTKLKRRFTLPFLMKSKPEWRALRDFIKERGYKRCGFWCPTYLNDYWLTADASNGATTLTIKAVGLSNIINPSAKTQFNFLALVTRNSIRVHEIINAVEGGGIETLTIEPPLSGALVAKQTVCCALLFVRLDEDAEWEFITDDKVRAELVFEELPTEYQFTGASVPTTMPNFMIHGPNFENWNCSPNVDRTATTMEFRFVGVAQLDIAGLTPNTEYWFSILFTSIIPDSDNMGIPLFPNEGTVDFIDPADPAAENLVITPAVGRFFFRLKTTATPIVPGVWHIILSRFGGSPGSVYVVGDLTLAPLVALSGAAHKGSQPVFLYELTRGVAVYRMANRGKAIDAGDETWVAENVAHSEIATGLDFVVEEVELRAGSDRIDHPLRYYLEREATELTTVRIFEADGDTGAVDLNSPIFKGIVSGVEYNAEGEIVTRLLNVTRHAGNQLPAIQVQRTCNHRLFDANCGLLESAFRITGTVSVVSSDPAFIESAAIATEVTARSDGNWFALGRIKVGSEVRLCVGTNGSSRVYLNQPFKGATVGMAVEALPGCDKRIGTCKNKFNNLANTIQFPYLPSANPQFEALRNPKPEGGKKS